jgi:hypothetical protein
MTDPIDTLPYLEWSDDAGAVHRIYADVWNREQTTMSATVTDFAIETGAKISDHYIADPDVVHVDLFISGSPTRGDLDDDFPGRVRSSALKYPSPPTKISLAGALEALGVGGDVLPGGIHALQFDGPVNRLGAVEQQIREWIAAGTLITIGTTTAVHHDVAVTSAEINRDDKVGDGGTISIEARSVKFVTSDVAVAVPLPVEPRAQKKKTSVANPVAEAGGGADSGVAASMVGAQH